MARWRLFLMLAGIGLAGFLSACSKVDEMLGQSAEPAPPPSPQAQATEEPRMLGRIGDFSRVLAPPPPEAPPPPLPLDHAAASDAPGPEGETLPNGARAGDKAQQIGAELDRLQVTVNAHTAEHERLRETNAAAADRFRAAVAMIGSEADQASSDQSASPQLGEAEARLTDVSDSIQQMEALRSQLVADAALASSLAEQARSAGQLAGAAEEDRRQLQRLKEAAQQAGMSLEALLVDLDDDILRQSAAVTREQRDLATLAMTIKSGEQYARSPGGEDETAAASMSSDDGPAATAAVPTSAGNAAASVAEGERAREPAPAAVIPPSAERKAAALRATDRPVARQPLMTIPFDRSDPDYEAGLYAAISEAVSRNPFASFEVVAVSSGGRPGATLAAARRNAQRVAQSLINMGVPEGRLKQSATTVDDDGADEVLVYMM